MFKNWKLQNIGKEKLQKTQINDQIVYLTNVAKAHLNPQQ